ncbi:MAG: DUF6524 family protein [Filomicrobium sp.]
MFRATAQSLGTTAVVLLALYFTGIIWSLASLGVIGTGGHTLMLYPALIVIATTLAIGMSWSIIQRRIAG